MVKRLKCWRKMPKFGITGSFYSDSKIIDHLYKKGEGLFQVLLEERYFKDTFQVKDFQVRIDKKNVRKQFKTKPQAEKFAKSFMKKHDVCS